MSWFCRLLIFFFKISLLFLGGGGVSKKIREYQQSVKQFGSRSCPLGLIWVQIVCKGNQQMTLVIKEFMTTIQANFRVDEK